MTPQNNIRTCTECKNEIKDSKVAYARYLYEGSLQCKDCYDKYVEFAYKENKRKFTVHLQTEVGKRISDAVYLLESHGYKVISQKPYEEKES